MNYRRHHVYQIPSNGQLRHPVAFAPRDSLRIASKDGEHLKEEDNGANLTNARNSEKKDRHQL